MKRVFYLAILIIFLFMLSSCSLPEKQENFEDNISLDEIDKIIGDPIDAFYSANVTIEKLEVESYLGNKFIFNGVEIPEDKGINFETIGDLLKAHIENDDLCPMGSGDIKFYFTKAVPHSITWYNHYYMDLNGQFLYPSLWQTNTIDNVDASVVLPIGMDLAVSLDSHYPPKEHYRILRIVCEFDNQTIEYVVIFDSVIY